MAWFFLIRRPVKLHGEPPSNDGPETAPGPVDLLPLPSTNLRVLAPKSLDASLAVWNNAVHEGESRFFNSQDAAHIDVLVSHSWYDPTFVRGAMHASTDGGRCAALPKSEAETFFFDLKASGIKSCACQLVGRGLFASKNESGTGPAPEALNIWMDLVCVNQREVGHAQAVTTMLDEWTTSSAS